MAGWDVVVWQAGLSRWPAWLVLTGATLNENCARRTGLVGAVYRLDGGWGLEPTRFREVDPANFLRPVLPSVWLPVSPGSRRLWIASSMRLSPLLPAQFRGPRGSPPRWRLATHKPLVWDDPPNPCPRELSAVSWLMVAAGSVLVWPSPAGSFRVALNLL